MGWEKLKPIFFVIAIIVIFSKVHVKGPIVIVSRSTGFVSYYMYYMYAAIVYFGRGIVNWNRCV